MANKKPYKRSFLDWLCIYSGEDYQLISHARTHRKAKLTFSFIGALVIGIFLLSFLSSTHFIYQLFNHNLNMAIPIGIVWGLVVIVIYLLLLYTITPRLLKSKEWNYKGKQIVSQVNNSWSSRLSLYFRIGFVLLLATVIAQPLIVYALEDLAQAHILRYKQQYRNDFIIQSHSLQITHELSLYKATHQKLDLVRNNADSLRIEQAAQKMFQKIKHDEFFLRTCSYLKQISLNDAPLRNPERANWLDSIENLRSKMVQRELETDQQYLMNSYQIDAHNNPVTLILQEMDAQLRILLQQKMQQYQKLESVLAASNLYIRKIQIINTNFPLAWAILGVIMIYFVLPIILKRRVRNVTNFYEVKRDVEEMMVKEEYESFSQEFAKIFAAKFSHNVSFYESYIDPPFNTIKKEQLNQCINQDQLLELIYNEVDVAEAHKELINESIS